MIFVEINGYTVLLKDIVGLDIHSGKVYLISGKTLSFSEEIVRNLAEKLKKINGITWITV